MFGGGLVAGAGSAAAGAFCLPYRLYKRTARWRPPWMTGESPPPAAGQ